MTAKQRVPAVRFRGFVGDWEKREFSNLVSRVTSAANSVELPQIEYEDIVSGEGRLNKDVLQKKYSKRGIGFLRGDILFGKLRPYLNNILLPDFDGIAVGDFWVLRAKDTSGPFLYSLVQHNKFQSFANQSTGSKMPRSDWSLVSVSGLLVPAMLDEQSQIGAFFQDLDNLIAQRQRRAEKLIAVKKAMLCQMFPQGNAAVPEIRFRGFSGKWKQQNLGQVYWERNERGNDSLPILSVSIHHGVSRGELDEENLGKKVRRSADKSLYKRVYPGDLVFNMMRAWQGAIGVATIDGMVSPAYITAVPDSEVFPPFMDVCLRRDQSVTQMNNLSYGVTDFRKRLYWDSFVRVSCFLPTVPEQAKIASYFSHLDSLITLQQRELDKLKNLKKAFLDKMFV